LIRRLGQILLLGGVVTAGSGCNDPADFKPAKGAADYPSSAVAYRLYSVGSDCTSIGIVEHATTIPAVATTVANHGGTHYVITDERMIEEVVTSGQSLGGAAYAHQTSNRSRTKQYTAEAYRCPPRPRGPEAPPAGPEKPAPPPSEPPPSVSAEPLADAGAD
jgi:hypothetical protein